MILFVVGSGQDPPSISPTKNCSLWSQAVGVMLDSECMHAMQAQARPVISLCCSALRGMPKLSSDNRGLVDVMHPEREGDEVLVTLPGLYQITVKIEHSPVFELPFETRKQLSDLSKFLKAKSIRCSKCEGMMNAEHFSRKNVDSIEERLLVIFSGEPRVQPFKRMVTCAWCSDGGKTWVQKLNEHIQRQEYKMEMTLGSQFLSARSAVGQRGHDMESWRKCYGGKAALGEARNA